MSKKRTNYKQTRIVLQSFRLNVANWMTRKEEKKLIQSRLQRLLGLFKKN